MSKTSPTELTLKFLRSAGYEAGVVERWIPQARKRIDLFGFADIVAVHPNIAGTLYVQTTSAANHAGHLAKVCAAPAARIVLGAGNRIWVCTWKKAGRLWEPRIEEVFPHMFLTLDALGVSAEVKPCK
jgi:hypothetical protein